MSVHIHIYTHTHTNTCTHDRPGARWAQWSPPTAAQKLKINHIHTTGLVCGGPSGVPQLRHEKHKPECGHGTGQVWVGALGLLRGADPFARHGRGAVPQPISAHAAGLHVQDPVRDHAAGAGRSGRDVHPLQPLRSGTPIVVGLVCSLIGLFSHLFF